METPSLRSTTTMGTDTVCGWLASMHRKSATAPAGQDNPTAGRPRRPYRGIWISSAWLSCPTAAAATAVLSQPSPSTAVTLPMPLFATGWRGITEIMTPAKPIPPTSAVPGAADVAYGLNRTPFRRGVGGTTTGHIKGVEHG